MLTCFVQSKEIFCEARKFCAKARKFFTKARKFPAKFDVFGLKRFMLQPRFDVNQSLQVETDGMHNFLRSVLTCTMVITSSFTTN